MTVKAFKEQVHVRVRKYAKRKGTRTFYSSFETLLLTNNFNKLKFMYVQKFKPYCD